MASPLHLTVLMLLSSLTLTFCANCDSYTDCTSCSAASTWKYWWRLDCQWCPLDRRCHTWLSQYTPCLSRMNIDEPDQCPVEHNEGTYDANQAYTNVLLSAAAYGQDTQQCLTKIYPAGNIAVQHIIAVRCDSFYSDYDECIAFTAVSSSQKTIYIAFRGSVTSEQIVDQVLSALILQSNSFKIGGTVVDYFDDAHDSLYPCVKGQVQRLRLRYPDYKVMVTGHSLGGALASLAAAALVYDGVVDSANIELYTFGMPRVGDKEYALNFDRLVWNSWNVVNYRDIVPHTPFCHLFGCNKPWDGPFHGKGEIYYSNNGTMSVNTPYTVCRENEDNKCSNGAVSSDPCYDLSSCIWFHLNYFNVRVWLHCNSTLGTTALPSPWSHKLPRQCKTFPN